jgi:hypothetical protein
MRVSMSERNMKAKKTYLIPIIILIAIYSFIMTPVFAEGASIFFDPAKQSVSKNEEFTILVKANSVSNLFAYQFDLKYNPNKYEIVSAEEGSFLNNNGTDSTFFLGPLNSSRKELITFACTRMGASGGIDGSGTLVKITFRAKTSGEAKINIVRKSVRLLNPNGQEIQ